MDTIRQIYQHIPSTIQVPDSLQNRKVEVILQPLDNQSLTNNTMVNYDWIGKW